MGSARASVSNFPRPLGCPTDGGAAVGQSWPGAGPCVGALSVSWPSVARFASVGERAGQSPFADDVSVHGRLHARPRGARCRPHGRVEGKNSKCVVVELRFGRAGPGVTDPLEVVHPRCAPKTVCVRSLRERSHVGADVEQSPMGEGAARRVGILGDDGDASRSGRDCAPGERRRLIGPVAREIDGNAAALRECGAGHRDLRNRGAGGRRGMTTVRRARRAQPGQREFGKAGSGPEPTRPQSG